MGYWVLTMFTPIKVMSTKLSKFLRRSFSNEFLTSETSFTRKLEIITIV